MDYFSKFLRPGGQPAVKVEVDYAQEFHKSWTSIKNTLEHPDERQLSRGIKSTDVPSHLKSLVDALVWESARTEEGGTGACLEYLLKNDVLGTLVRLSESDRPFGIQAEVLRSVQNMVVLLDEQFLVHSAVHKAVLRLLRNCVGDDIQEQLDGRNRVVGAARNSVRSQPSEYEEDLVNLLCILCSRIRHYRELLMIFFHDKQWYRPEPLFSVEEEDEGEEEPETNEEPEPGDEHSEKQELKDETTHDSDAPMSLDEITPAPSQTHTQPKKAEYEFLLFNYLLRFAHREGQIGDFARAGLLFLMDVAMSPIDHASKSGIDKLDSSVSSTSSDPDPHADAALALAEYIVDGDFSDVLAAGLAAVYSTLPTKLEISPPVHSDASQSSGMVLGSNAIELSEDAQEKQEIEKEKNRAMGIEESANPDFKSRLDHFLKLIEFLQDVLRRNVVPDSADGSLEPSALLGSAIVQSILDAVRRVFFENVLYPSILECSDIDGSAVAVMSYIEIMIRTLDGGQLGDLLVEFLTSEDDTEDFTRSRMRPHAMLDLTGSAPPVTRSSSRAAKMRRRKSAAMVLLEMEAPESRKQSEYFTSMGRFTLKDLLLSSLRSTSLPTVISALQLLQSMLYQYCKLSVDKLLIVIHDPYATNFPQPLALPPPPEDIPPPPAEDDEEETFVYPEAESSADAKEELSQIPYDLFAQPNTSYSTHEREMGLYLALVSRVDPNHVEDTFSTGYEHYLRDALISIQTQKCTQDPYASSLEDRAKLKHRLNSNDPMLLLILESLGKFFSNSPECNMALTGVLATLALCPDRSLAGWLTFAAKEGEESGIHKRGVNEYMDFSYDGDGDDRSIDWRIEDQLSSGQYVLPASSLDEKSRPVVYTVLHGLVTQLERYRQLVDGFDQFLRERRQGLLFSENLTDALNLALELEGAFTPTPKSAQPLVSASASTDTGSGTSRPKPKPKSSSSFVSFLSPRKAKQPKSSSIDATVHPKSGKVETSPFGPHYRKTGSIMVEPFTAPLPSSGPWTPAKPAQWNDDEEDVLTSSNQWGGESGFTAQPTETYEEERQKQQQRVSTVTLSLLLDNVVILEESIKELVAIIHARRSLGIDSIRYL
ncbi:Retinoic acid induced 16-like protein-domain-containing protein [Irpex rosettiformis]|uniref:Retinoic acid induced 16-like protein-domain-containing protein n=1 Tax=Irpex rosettiformis TaxID=378272 RepID=A0ACB8UHX0_9APHY|nr:Retinoic acid induced 16-like protein-domain-containing protein [Irpex rosettiformis]